MKLRWRIGLIIHNLADIVQGPPEPISAETVKAAIEQLRKNNAVRDVCPCCGSGVYRAAP